MNILAYHKLHYLRHSTEILTNQCKRITITISWMFYLKKKTWFKKNKVFHFAFPHYVTYRMYNVDWSIVSRNFSLLTYKIKYHWWEKIFVLTLLFYERWCNNAKIVTIWEFYLFCLTMIKSDLYQIIWDGFRCIHISSSIDAHVKRFFYVLLYSWLNKLYPILILEKRNKLGFSEGDARRRVYLCM